MELCINNIHKCLDVVANDIVSRGHSISDIKGIGITNHRESTVVWDKTTGKPLHNAIGTLHSH
jgi:glycerol kinase